MKEQFVLKEITVHYRKSIKLKSNPTIKSSLEIFALIRKMWNRNTIQYVEEFKVIYLNQANTILGVHTVSKGGITGTVVDMRVIFGIAVKVNAINMILVHNHPSGNLTPSMQDRELTQKIKEAARLFDMKVVDHLIVSDSSYLSFNDEGLL